MDNRPIGVFDSGLGGLTVVKEIKKVLPNEQIVYLGDTARVPYGTRSKETIIKFAIEDANFLFKKNVKCIVVACNSVSSVATDILKNKYKIPIFNMITPTCEYVGKIKRLKRVGIIGTTVTVESNTYKNNLKKYNKKLSVFQNKAPLLVPLVEEGEVNSNFTYEIVKTYLSPLIQDKVDSVILGCTHYPVLMSLFKKILGNNVLLIDPAVYTSKNIFEYLSKNNLLSSSNNKQDDFFFLTDLSPRSADLINIFLEEKISLKIKQINLEKRYNE